MRDFRARWGAYLARVGHREAEIMLVALFFLVVLPVAVVRRISLRRPLLDSGSSPSWIPRGDRPATFDELRRMF